MKKNQMMTILRMGVDPIDELLSLAKQQQIAKLFRFGTPKEIKIWEQSVALNKSKSLGDNPTNQRSNYDKHRKKLKKIRRNLQSLKIKSKTAKNLRKKRLYQQIKKRELLDFNWHENTPDDLKQTIKKILTEVKNKRGHRVAVKIKDILENYQDRIGKEKFDIGRIDGIEYKIKMKPGVKPYSRQPHNLAPEHEAEVEKTVKVLLKHGLIEPYEGPWASNVFVVINPDGSTRMVTNYKWINSHSYSDSYPTPSVPDMINRFHGKTIYSTFDIIKAFHNIPVEKESRKYTAFTTKYGTFVWKVMPFGGKNCPAVWARASDLAFRTCKDMIKYVDDIVLASKAENGKSEDENHIAAIRSFFECLKKHNLKIKLSKCEFFVTKVKFLGHYITPEGRTTNEKYIKRLLTFRHPKDRTELKAYLGAIEWISNHVYGMKKLMLPIKELLRKNVKYIWLDKHQKAFNSIQNCIQNTEILHHPDFNEPFYLFTDASDKLYSGVLLQKRDGKYVTIDMFSRMFNDNQVKWHITSKELHALVQSISKWHNYLWTNKFTIHTDANNLRHLFRRTNNKSSNNQMHYQWVVLLNEYDFDVMHIRGIDNKIADYLSRYVNKEQLENFTEGTRSLSEYKANKRYKFENERKKKQFKENQRIFYANIPNYLKKWFKNDDYYKELNKPMPEEITLNSHYVMYMAIGNREKMYPNQRKSKRLEDKRKRKRGEDTDKSKSKPKDVGDILKGHRFANWQDTETDEDYSEDDYSTMNSMVSDRSYQIEDRIYMAELLKDPAIETLERFNIGTIRQNQQTFPYHQIITKHLKGIDTMNEVNDLPNNMKADVRQGKYKLREEDDLLLYVLPTGETRICLPPEHIKTILKYTHENMLTGGHMSANAMAEEIKQRFYWSGYHQHIKDYVNECQCKFAKRIPDRKVGKMITFEAKEINDTVAIDHIGPLVAAPQGYKYITTYYDKFSGYTKSIPAKRIDAFSTAANFVMHWICIFGPPNSILTDLGSDFRGEIMEHLTSMVATKHRFTTAHHSRSDGGVERFNRTLQQALRAISLDKKLKFSKGDPWNLYLSYINCVHNNKKSPRTNMKLSPNEIFIGRNIRTPLDFQLKANKRFRHRSGRMYEDYVKTMIRINDGIAKREMKKYKAKQKEYYDRNRKVPNYKNDDLVLYWNGVYPPKGKDKLAVHWKGPYRVIKVFNEGNNLTLMNVRYPNIIHNANVDKVMRFIPKREWEFNQYGQRIRRGNVASDVSLDISMDSDPYYSAEEKESEPLNPNSVQSVNAADLEAESEQTIVDSMDANADSLEPPAIPDLEPVDLTAPEIDKEDTEFPSLPVQSEPSAPKQGLKRTYSEMESNSEIKAAPATKRQRINLLKLFKRLLFKKKNKVRKRNKKTNLMEKESCNH